MDFGFKKKNKINGMIYSWPVIFVLLCVALLLIKSVFNIYQSEKQSRVNKEQSEKMATSLRERNDAIASEIELLKTEKGIEMEIRDKFRVVKEGEQLAVIINSGEKPEKQSGDIAEITMWRKILNFFK
ncbi:MAG: septum formation initiator family protein [Patescibacteria group bacterium]